jgi:hypothetical protein
VGALQRRDAGRNDSCPCGSGRKFKACCSPRVVYMRTELDCGCAAVASLAAVRYERRPTRRWGRACSDAYERGRAAEPLVAAQRSSSASPADLVAELVVRTR